MAEEYIADVTIIGAGLAGASLALALSGHNLSIRLVESKSLKRGSLISNEDLNGFDLRVTALTPRSVNLLERLEVWQAVKNFRVCPYNHMVVWDAEGTGRIEFDCAAIGAPRLGTIVENGVLLSELLSKVESKEDIAFLTPDSIDGFSGSHKEDLLNITLSSGRSINTRLLVAADGAYSKVRELAGFKINEWEYGQRAIVATVEVEKYHQATAWQRFLCTGPLAFLPLSENSNSHFCSIVWSCDNWLAEQLATLSDEDFCVRLSHEFEYTLGKVLGISSRIVFPLRQRHSTAYYKPQVALIGDSAHTIHPLAGQGINLGLQDVEIFAEEILAAHKANIAIGSQDVLARYQRRRKGENLQMMLVMEGFKRLFGSREMPIRWLRNVGLSKINGMPGLKKYVIRYAMGIN